MSVSELSSLRSIVDTVYATHAPSGLMRGSPTLLNSKMSSGVSGRRDCAETVKVRPRPDTTYIEQNAAAVVMNRRLVIFDCLGHRRRIATRLELLRTWCPALAGPQAGRASSRSALCLIRRGVFFRSRRFSCGRFFRGRLARRGGGRAFEPAAASSGGGALRVRAAEQLRGGVDRNRFHLGLLGFLRLDRRDDFPRLRLDRFHVDDVDDVDRLRRQHRSLQRRSLEDAETAASIAFDPYVAFLLTRLQEIHQPAESE